MILSCNQNFATQNNDIKEELIDMSLSAALFTLFS